MATPLKSVVPFGRTLDEYGKFFKLDKADLAKRILGVGDGPASFNAELTARGGRVVSIDPVYEFSAKEIEKRFNEIVDDIIEKVKATPDDWVWTYQGSPEQLKTRRTQATKGFCADFDAGKASGRYICASLPKLPFKDGEFELALCSHFLFLYAEQLSLDFHIASLREIMRIACEARIFPLNDLMNRKSRHLDATMKALSGGGFLVELEKVPYEFQKGADRMLRIRRRP